VKGGYVALLDVLGFSALVGSDPSGEKIGRYLECLTAATEHSQVNYVVFSDSIVLTAEGDDPESLLAVAGACSRLIADLLKEDIPLRGAISFGNFVRSSIEKSVFVAGRAVIDACQFEQAQDWVGVMVAPSALAHVRDLNTRCPQVQNYSGAEDDIQKQLPWPAFIQPCHGIPFHASSPFDQPRFDGFAVVPTNGVPEPAPLSDSISSAIERLKWLRSIAPSPGAQEKYQATINWLSNIQSFWLNLAWRQKQPAAQV
jgi:hypothetical protein